MSEHLHGPLSFRGGTATGQRCTGHKGKFGAAGRYRVAIAGHPLLDGRGWPIVICEKCRNEMCAEWDAALGIEEAVAA